MDWNQISEPGSYLHIATGLIARVYPEDLAAPLAHRENECGGLVVRLLSNPGAPISVLREIGERHGFRVNS